MKAIFDLAEIPHSEWLNTRQVAKIKDFYAEHKIIIAKHRHSSKGEGIYFIASDKQLDDLVTAFGL